MPHPNIDLKIAIIRKGISQRELEIAVNIGKVDLSEHINGYRKLPNRAKRKIAQILGEPLEKLARMENRRNEQYCDKNKPKN